MTTKRVSTLRMFTVVMIIALILGSAYVLFSTKPGALDSCVNKHNTRARDICLSNIALDDRDTEICKKIHDAELQIRCYVYIAAALDRPDLCLRLADPLWQLNCEDLAKPGFQGCYLLPRGLERRDRCLSVYAEITHNLSLCDELSVEELRQAWRDDCYISIAVSEGDLAICGKINWDQGEKARCFASMALLREDFRICESEGVETDLCYYYLAQEAENATLCARMSTKEARQSCEFQIRNSKN